MENFEKILDFRNRENNFNSYLGIKMTDLKKGYAQGEIKIKDEFKNTVNTVHGGLTFTLAD